VRTITSKDLAYEVISREWSDFIDTYDTDRRTEVLIDEFLADKIKSRSCLDVGCGLGFFTRALWRHSPSAVTAIDISEALVTRLAHESPYTRTMVGDVLALDEILMEEFDVVVSSEVIEHTPDPHASVIQLAKRVKPGGYLSMSCPNARWSWLLRLAQLTRLRKNYQGYENWVYAADLVHWIESAGLVVVLKRGIHFVPWQLFPKRSTRMLDRLTRNFSFGLAIDLAILARRPH
jgi:2-polyprenyl-3-methyl-5-hydroxy-6-metoxy-1,4-benzoquinol methylase